MIDETSHIALLESIDNLVVGPLHQVSYIYLLVLHFKPLLSKGRILIEDFSRILHDKTVFWDSFAGEQSPAFLFGLFWVDMRILR